MMHVGWRGGACVVAAAWLAGCGGAGGRGDRADVFDACAAVEACDFESGVRCRDLFDVIVPTAECTQAVEEASCDDYTETLPPWMDECFPSCSKMGAECNGNGTLTACEEVLGELRTATVDCEAVCRQQGYVYFAGCSETFLDQTSETGFPVCWCSE